MTEHGIKNKAQNAGKVLTKVNFKKGKTYKINLKLISRPTQDATFSNYINDDTTIITPFWQLQNMTLNNIITKTYTATADCEYKIILWGNANSEIFEFQFWIEENEVTDYEKHEEQSFKFPLKQKLHKQDFLASDGIHHKRKTILLNGTENWSVGTTNNAEKRRFSLVIDNIQSYANEIAADINCDKLETRTAVRTYSCVESISGTSQTALGGKTGIYIYIDECSVMTTAQFKEYLSNNNITIEIPLLKEEIELYNEEQQKIYNQIEETAHTYKNITHIDCTDEISCNFNIEYYKDLETLEQNQNDRLTAIEQLLSTTSTSALLLDNLQTDLESEVIK